MNGNPYIIGLKLFLIQITLKLGELLAYTKNIKY